MQTEYNRPFLALLLSLGCWKELIVVEIGMNCRFGTKGFVDSGAGVGGVSAEGILVDVVLSLVEARAAARVEYFC